jgi:putative SOS response-associated peptidase YedK
VDDDPVAFGGIWETRRSPEGETMQTFATITTDANRMLSTIQDRMPVITEPENWPLWLGEVDGNPATLLRPAAQDVLHFWPIDKEVGNVRNDGPDLIKRVSAEPVLL